MSPERLSLPSEEEFLDQILLLNIRAVQTDVLHPDSGFPFVNICKDP